MKKLIILCLSGAFFACSTVKVFYDYDKQVDFTQYKTYQYSEGIQQLGVSDLNRDRIMKAVDNEMDVKGFSKANNPDVLVDIYLKSQQKVDATAYISGMGGPWRYGYGGGFSTTHVSYNEYTEGTLFVNLVDMSSEKMVWQGIGKKAIDESADSKKRDKIISWTIQQIYMNYPPE